MSRIHMLTSSPFHVGRFLLLRMCEACCVIIVQQANVVNAPKTRAGLCE